MEIKTATGYYANFFNEDGLDLFVILNEQNKEPTTNDYIFIENTVTEYIDRCADIHEDRLKEVLNEHFEGGVQIVNKSFGYTKL